MDGFSRFNLIKLNERILIFMIPYPRMYRPFMLVYFRPEVGKHRKQVLQTGVSLSTRNRSAFKFTAVYDIFSLRSNRSNEYQTIIFLQNRACQSW
jgi:hypothetical protein